MAKAAFEEVRDLVAEVLRVKKELITPQSRFVEDLKADSLDLVELTMAAEDKYDIEIPDEDTPKLRTVQDAINYFNERLNQ